ncbi:hypothetical protein [Psychromonas sp. psych-6C06]|nr:hypothetical protein [Psychromonas sp. psych-6C06]
MINSIFKGGISATKTRDGQKPYLAFQIKCAGKHAALFIYLVSKQIGIPP